MVLDKPRKIMLDAAQGTPSDVEHEYRRVPVEVEALVDPTETPSQGLRRAFHVDVQRWGLEHVPNAPVLFGDAVVDTITAKNIKKLIYVNEFFWGE